MLKFPVAYSITAGESNYFDSYHLPYLCKAAILIVGNTHPKIFHLRKIYFTEYEHGMHFILGNNLTDV